MRDPAISSNVSSGAAASLQGPAASLRAVGAAPSRGPP